MPADNARDLHDNSKDTKATAFNKAADTRPDRAGRGAGQPAQSPQTDRQPTHEPQTAKNESIKQSLALPSDRDESTHMTGAKANDRHDPEIEQAARDLKAGLKDTSRAPEMDRSYKKMSGKPDE